MQVALHPSGDAKGWGRLLWWLYPVEDPLVGMAVWSGNSRTEDFKSSETVVTL